MTASVLDDLRTRWVRGFVAMPDWTVWRHPGNPRSGACRIRRCGWGCGTAHNLVFFDAFRVLQDVSGGVTMAWR
jgi:hypothetical protein